MMSRRLLVSIICITFTLYSFHMSAFRILGIDFGVLFEKLGELSTDEREDEEVIQEVVEPIPDRRTRDVGNRNYQRNRVNNRTPRRERATNTQRNQRAQRAQGVQNLQQLESERVKKLKRVIKNNLGQDCRLYSYAQFVKYKLKKKFTHTQFPLERACAAVSKDKKVGVIHCMFDNDDQFLSQDNAVGIARSLRLQRDYDFNNEGLGFLVEQAKTVIEFKEYLQKRNKEVDHWFIVAKKSMNVDKALFKAFLSGEWIHENRFMSEYILASSEHINIMSDLEPVKVLLAFNELYKYTFKGLYGGECSDENVPFIKELVQFQYAQKQQQRNMQQQNMIQQAQNPEFAPSAPSPLTPLQLIKQEQDQEASAPEYEVANFKFGENEKSESKAPKVIEKKKKEKKKEKKKKKRVAVVI